MSALPRTIDQATARNPAPALPEWPCGWYVVSRSRDLKPGAIRSATLAGREIVIARTVTSELMAMDAHCPHMGAHLARGRVHGERLQCALHGYQFSRHGDADGGRCGPAITWPVRERFGLVFVGLGTTDRHPLPGPRSRAAHIWTTAAPHSLPAHWHAMAANGFDMLHLCTVHRRELIRPPEIDSSDDHSLSLVYTSRVTGSSVSDRLMRRLSGNCIRVRMTCHGTVIIAETDLGMTTTAAVLGMLPGPDGLTAYGAFGIQPGWAPGLRLLLTKVLFMAFLRRDFAVVAGMRLRADADEPGVESLVQFLARLPDAAR